jgi:Family of unknown function (DUF5686)
MIWKGIFTCFLLLVVINTVNAQISIKGIVLESDSITTVDNAVVQFKKARNGGQTLPSGAFDIVLRRENDTLIISKTGYEPLKIAVNKNKELPTKFYLQKSNNTLTEIKIFKKGNRAWTVLKKIQEFKDNNNPAKTNGLEYEVYNNITMQLSHLEKIKNASGLIGRVIKEYRKANPEADTTFIPVFLSEAVSEVYARQNPKLTKEIIKNTQVKTLGLETDGVVNELVGSSFQGVNFYDESIRFLGKQFTSPVATNWKQTFNYQYKGITTQDDRVCYNIEFAPKNKLDIELSGNMKIDTASFSILKMKVYLDDRANINYVKDFAIEQFFEMPKTYDRFYPVESIIDLTLAITKKESFGMKAHLSSSAYNIRNATPRAESFYLPAVERNTNSVTESDSFWNKTRSYGEVAATQTTIAQIASIQNSPTVSFIEKGTRFLASGYAPTKSNIQIGSYQFMYAHNNIEGNRFQIGLRGRDLFNKNFAFNSYIAYGMRDKKYKGMVQATFILNRKPWIEVMARYENDNRRLGINSMMYLSNSLSSELLQLSNHWGYIAKGYHTESYLTSISHEIKPGIGHSLTLLHENFNPLFPFRYLEPVPLGQPDVQAQDININEINYQFRYAPGDIVVRNNTKRAVRLKKTRERNIYQFNYTYGMAGIHNFYKYHKFYLELNRKFTYKKIGNASVRVGLAYTPSTVPYPLLFIQIGNPTPLFAKYAFNTMNFFEFTTDKYIRINYLHNFDGLITNRIPLIKRLQLRTHATVNGLWGGLSPENKHINPDIDNVTGQPLPRFKTLQVNRPYIETGIGVSNIFKVIRIDVFRRIDYLEPDNNLPGQPNNNRRQKPFYFKISALFGL